MSESLAPGAALAWDRSVRLTVERVIYRSVHTQRELYRVHNSEDGLSYALKVVPVDSADALAAVRREAVALNSQIGDPRLPRFRGLFQRGNRAYLLLDWLAGTRFDELTRGQPANSGEELELRLDFAIEACRTVALLHEKRFKHRDVKPENLLAQSRTNPRDGVALVDLGLATQPRSYEEGTRGFQAPEQLGNRNLNLTTATDVFALAQVAWFLFTGSVRDPIQAEGAEAWHTLGPTLRELLPSLAIPAGLEQVLDKAFAFKPEQRHPHAHALAGALRAVRPTRRR